MVPRVYYFSAVRLTLAATLLGASEFFFVAGVTLFISKHHVIATLLAIGAAILCYPLSILIYRLRHIKQSAVKIERGKLVFSAGFREKVVDLSAIKSVSLLSPNSEEIGETLHIEMHGTYEKGQWRLCTLSIPLALIAVQSTKLVEEINSHIAISRRPTHHSSGPPSASAEFKR